MHLSYYNNLGAKFAPFAGYSMPVNFNSGIINEHIHTRNKCGLFDISHMGKMLIPMNNDNVKKLEKIIPQNLQLLSKSHSVYSFILNSLGGIVDDIIISKITIEYSQIDFPQNLTFPIKIPEGYRKININELLQ